MDGMFRWAEDTEVIERIALESRGGGTSKADAARATFFGESASDKESPEPKPTLSFFAAAAGALALGAQANRDQNGNGIDEDNAMAVDDVVLHGGASSRSASSSSQVKKVRTTASTQSYQTPNTDSRRSFASPTMLFALSEQALDIFEKSNVYDLDYLVALIMQALYMLHGGKPVVDHRLYPLVGKMVNVARMMGLAMDPDEFPGKYSLFEAETRRRIWWDVFCYDLYVSDSMGHPPTIPDNSFTTKMPIDVDENSFSPSSTSIPTPSTDDHASRYFGLKLRMAQIVKSVKKRTFKDPLMDSPSPFSAEFPERSSSSACLIAQQCELVITGQRLILKIYLPFLRPNHTSNTNHQAAVGTINAAHAVIYASRILHAICKQSPGSQSKRPGPAIFDYYSFGQALFDAAVVCAHSVIMQPNAIWARVALDDVVDALEVMKDPAVATGRGSLQGYVEGCASEPVKIVEMLKKKADGVRAGNRNSPRNSNSKRKHSEVDTHTDHLAAGFQLPYVGAAVASAGPATGSSSGSSAQASSPPEGTQSDGTALSNGSEGSGMKRLDAGKMKMKNKKARYPIVGIPVRASKESPAAVHRERADSTASTASLTEIDARMPSSSSLSSVSHVSVPTPTDSHHSFGIPITQAPSPTYQSPPSADSMQPPTQQEVVHNSHNEYPSSFASADSNGLHMNLSSMHQYTIQEAGAQHGYSSRPSNQMPVYDQNQNNPYRMNHLRRTHPRLISSPRRINPTLTMELKDLCVS
ncbi:hypothetical protein PILCRDRAFT_114018 [Piloderma croceum F 1598]|uniref:Xylanolytic transcriptional activator regulatory domain-containing protein n=1 Tax=Piloderma croceum (strain F 1598) TaxID=765440 RepID=A0A0C3GKS9_PILCF|nr:hypothetical protein PILCRDRAFT_114018 [Piloderma croceum F 1598]